MQRHLSKKLRSLTLLVQASATLYFIDSERVVFVPVNGVRKVDVATITASIVAVTGLLMAVTALLREIRSWKRPSTRGEVESDNKG